MENKFEEKKLDNGVPVLMVYYPDGETITLGISFNVGGRNEWQMASEYNGISHFLEHQFFKGNSNTTPIEVLKAIDSLGGLTNAFTTEQATCYYTKCLNTELDNAIDLWSELLNYGEISKEEFDKESFIVRQEFRRFEDNPPFYILVNLQMILFKGTSLEMNVIGNEESLSSVTTKQMTQYRDTYYGLENSVILLLGAFDKEKAYKKLNQSLGKTEIKNNAVKYKLTDFTRPKISQMRVMKFNKKTPLTFFGFAIKAPGGRSEDIYALELLESFLSLGHSSMIQEDLIRTGLTAFASSFLRIFEDVSSLMIIVGSSPNLYLKSHETTFKMIHRLLTRRFTKNDLNEICNHIEYKLNSTLEEPMAMHDEQAMGYWNYGRFISPDEYLQKLRLVTIEQFNKVRDSVLSKLNGEYAVMGGPDNLSISFPEGTWDGNFIFNDK